MLSDGGASVVSTADTDGTGATTSVAAVAAASASERQGLEFLQGNFVAPIGIRFMFELQHLRRFLCSLLHVLIIGRFCETLMMA
jgi:hypothetical protein